MVQEELSKEDLRRVNNCDYYKQTKLIMKVNELHKNFVVGEVYFIKEKRSGGKDRYVSRAYGNKPDKFMIFHKDSDGFVFVKRINANGKLGKEVQCLTTQYANPRYEFEADPEYIESIILDDEASYDPLKAEKALNKLKGQIRRKNKKLEIVYDDAADAYKAICAYKVNDVIYDANTTYGQGIMEWTVTQIESAPTCQQKMVKTGWRGDLHGWLGKTSDDRKHNQHGLDKVVTLTLECKHSRPDCRRWVSTKKTITFNRFMKSERYGTWYHTRPHEVQNG